MIHCPVIVFIPGRLLEQRVYLFMNTKEEFMYRGDLEEKDLMLRQSVLSLYHAATRQNQGVSVK
jgi:hypothetical protein